MQQRWFLHNIPLPAGEAADFLTLAATDFTVGTERQQHLLLTSGACTTEHFRFGASEHFHRGQPATPSRYAFSEFCAAAFGLEFCGRAYVVLHTMVWSHGASEHKLVLVW